MAPFHIHSHVTRCDELLRPWLPNWVATPVSAAALAIIRAS